MKLHLNFSTKKPSTQLAYFVYIICIGFVITLIFETFLLLAFTQSQQCAEPIFNNLALIKWSQLISQICVFLLPSVFFAYYFSNNSLAHNLSINKTKTSLFLIAFALLLFILPFITWIGNINQHVNFPYYLKGLEENIRQQELAQTKVLMQLLTFSSTKDFIFSFIIMAILPAICEEFFFRSTLHQIFFRLTGKVWFTICITAFIFSFIHFQFLGFLPRFALGILFSFLFVYTNSILPSMVLHFLFNGTQIVIIYIINDKLYLEKSLRGEDINISTMIGLFSLVFSTFIIWYLYKKNKSINIQDT